MTELETVTSEENEATQQDSVKLIEVDNPSAEEMAGITEQITANFDFDVNTKPTRFNFKKSTDKDTGIETIRSPVELAIPYPSVQGIVAILEAGGKQLELLMDAVESVVNGAARELLYDDVTLNAATFPVDKISWDAISKIPKAQRRGGGIPKETWEDFAKDYCAVMPEVTGKTPDQIANMAKILTQKLNPVKTNEPVLNLVVEQLALYLDESANAADFQECVEFLLNKADTFLNVSPEDLLANL